MKNFAFVACLACTANGNHVATAFHSTLKSPLHQSALLDHPTPNKIRWNPLSAKLDDIQHDVDGVAPFDPLDLSTSVQKTDLGIDGSFMVAAVAFFSAPGIASAAAPDAISSALAAYVHYLSLLVITASIMVERLTIKPAMSIDEEKRVAIADIIFGLSGLSLVVSGFYRATAYGKGWEFYSHEPVFWFKMLCMGIWAGLSLFPTITTIQRSIKIQREGAIEPMSDALAKRMTQIMNAEISALAFIPLTATFMARGVGYIDDFPTQIVGPVLFGLVTGGACTKYVKEALSWDESIYLTAKNEESD